MKEYRVGIKKGLSFQAVSLFVTVQGWRPGCYLLQYLLSDGFVLQLNPAILSGNFH